MKTMQLDNLLAQFLRAQDWTAFELGQPVPSVNLAAGQSSHDLWERIEYHGIAALIFYGGKSREWSKTHWHRVSEEARLAALWEATHQEVVASAIEHLALAGIKTVAMKGTALAYALYPKPELRRRGDTDLLVRSDDLPKTRRVLAETGWSPIANSHGLYFQENWIFENELGFEHVIDLHWQTSDRPIVQAMLPISEIFASAMPLPGLSPNANRPSHAITLVQCTLNQQWHFIHGYWMGETKPKGAHRLVWQYDIDLLARSFDNADWDQLESIAQRKGIGPLIGETMLRSKDLFNTPLPVDRISALVDMPIDPMFDALMSSTDSLSEFWLDLRSTSTWEGRFNLLRNRAFPPQSHLMEKYPKSTRWPKSLLNVRFFLDTAKRVLRKTIRQ